MASLKVKISLRSERILRQILSFLLLCVVVVSGVDYKDGEKVRNGFHDCYLSLQFVFFNAGMAYLPGG